MDYIASGPMVWLCSAALLLLVWFIAERLGSVLISGMGLPLSVTASERRLFSAATGITLVALGVLAIGLLGWLDRWHAGALLALLGGAPFIFKLQRSGFCIPKLSKNSGPYQAALIFLIAMPLFLSWVQALMPATGTDALAYHLYHPKEFIEHHRIFSMPFDANRESLWPYQTEMLFTLGLLFQGMALAQLFHWSFYPLTAAAIYLLTGRFYGRRAAILAALMFLYTPVVFAQSGYAYVDLSLAFFTLLAVYLFVLWEKEQRLSLVLLCGVFCGAALGTKYLGLGSFLILLLMTAVRSRINWKPTLVFVSACALIGGVWYFRSWLVTGNPVYPFFSGIFKGRAEWGTPLELINAAGVSQGKYFDIANPVPMRGLKGFLLLLWNMTFNPAIFGGEMLGPFFLMFLPFFILRPQKPSRAGVYLTAFAAAYTYFVFSQSQYTRFFLSCATFWALGAGVAMDRILAKGSLWLKRVAWAALLLVIALHLGIFVYRLRDNWNVFLGREEAAVFLNRHSRSFEGQVYFRDHMKPGERLFVSGEVEYFYGNYKNVVWDTLFFRNALKCKGKTALQYLTEQKPDYIWLVDNDDSFSLYREFAATHGYELAHSYDFSDKPFTFKNFIYKLKS